MTDILVPFFFFATITAIAWIVIGSIRQVSLVRAQTGVQARVIDKLPSAESLMAYSETTAGRSLLSSLSVGSTASNSPYKSILNGVQAAILLIVFGITLFLLPKFAPTLPDTNITIFGVISIALGIGFALATAATWLLSSRFGLLTPPQHTHALSETRS